MLRVELCILRYWLIPGSSAEGFVIPLDKKFNLSYINIYRGITLLSTISELISRMIKER